MIAVLFEIKCLSCGHSRGVRDAWAEPGALDRERKLRCERCGGSLYAEHVRGRPEDYGLPARESEPGPIVVVQVGPRRCIGYGAQPCDAVLQRAQRCRRCYLRHRYATNPEARRKQLALQAEWRRRQGLAVAS